MPVSSSYQNVAIGCGGVYYPPYWYGDSLFDSKLFREYCPSADDLWLKANELNNGKVNLNDRQWSSLNELWKLDELYLKMGE